jgi:hypothetical protein
MMALGAVIILGVLFGGTLLLLTTSKLDSEIRAELDEELRR